MMPVMAMKIHARSHHRLAKIRNTKRTGKSVAQHSAVPEICHARCEVLEQTDQQKCHQPNAGYGQ